MSAENRKNFGGAAQPAATDFEVFIDMDGVLSDFDKHARDHGKFDATGQPKWDELDFKWW